MHCTDEPETGTCRDSFTKWYYDPRSQSCTRFNYGGCDGNENRFESQQQCMQECNGVTGEFVFIWSWIGHLYMTQRITVDAKLCYFCLFRPLICYHVLLLINKYGIYSSFDIALSIFRMCNAYVFLLLQKKICLTNRTKLRNKRPTPIQVNNPPPLNSVKLS